MKKVIGLIIYLIQITCYTYTFLKNPGIPTKRFELDYNDNLNETLKEIKSYKICEICNIIMDKNLNTKHCDDCEVCIEGIK